MARRTSVLKEYREHLQDEADSAFLYRALAEVEPDRSRRDVYLRLAEVEDHHTALWVRLLADAGQQVGEIRPSARARALSWTARRFGSAAVSSLMLREEGREVKGYLSFSHTAEAPAAREAALRLARESAEHAQTLGGVMGIAGEPWHRASSGGFLRNVVYGFNDGLTANFGLVAGVIGASVTPHVILLSGVAGLIADALSMGASGFLAAKSEREVYEHELAMESAEIRLMPEVEAQELALVYEARGVDRDAARRIADDVMRDPERALAEKAREELGIGEQHSTPLREGVLTGAATAVGALIPVAPFVALHGPVAMWSSFAVAMVSHFAVGAARSVFTGRGLLRSGIDMFVVGLGVAAVGYLVGDLVARLL
jgi:VIT1/CCC1 family predicted Fe2+/Mn2+ transporter/rubrerythrin